MPSKSDRADILEKRNKDALNKLPEYMKGEYKQVDIKKIKGE